MESPEFHFDTYVFRKSTGLYANGRRVPLSPKEQLLLALLLESRGDLVTHRDIEAAIWPRQQISYSSIARTVHGLRQALGGDRERYITTIPKRGYRLRTHAIEARNARKSSIADISLTDSRQAYAHYLEGVRAANQVLPASQNRAALFFEQAGSTDPHYAAAYAALADVRVYQGLRGYLKPAQALSLALQACDKALTINPDNVPARCTNAVINGLAPGGTNDALRAIDAALRDDPQHAQGELWRSLLLRAVGRVQDAVIAARKAADLEPHSILTRHAKAWCLFAAGEAEEAIEIERRVIAEHPGEDDAAYGYLAIIAAWLGYHDEAREACDVLATRFSSIPQSMTAVAYALAKRGAVADAVSLAARLEREESPRASRAMLAPIYIVAEDPETALRLLRVARDESCPWFRIAHVDPRNRSLFNRVALRYGTPPGTAPGNADSADWLSHVHHY